MINKETKYAYKDLTIVPSTISKVASRSEVNCRDEKGYLPIFTAPMSCIVNEKNFECFESRGIYSVLPTTVDINIREKYLIHGYWVAMSMNETREHFIDNMSFNTQNCKQALHLCIDVANGHMQTLLDLCDEVKAACKTHNLSIEIMTGNIANPETILQYVEHDIDYVRVGIGGGSGCTTTSNTGCHYPMASLIDECNRILLNSDKTVKIVADGGIRNYDDINKALALGADYVMIGGLFSETIEAASKEYYLGDYSSYYLYTVMDSNWDKYSMSNASECSKRNVINSEELYHKVYGMSTKEAQKERGLTNLKTSEGTSHYKKIKYTLSQWTENMEDYLKSIMSYCNARRLSEFIGVQTLVVNSVMSVSSVNK